jgi:hypothetical protein
MLPEFEQARASLRRRGVVIDHRGLELVVRKDDSTRGERFDTWTEAVARGEEIAAAREKADPRCAPLVRRKRRVVRPATVQGWRKRHMKRHNRAVVALARKNALRGSANPQADPAKADSSALEAKGDDE